MKVHMLKTSKATKATRRGTIPAAFAAVVLMLASLLLPQTATFATSASPQDDTCVIGTSTIAECFPDSLLASSVANAASDGGHNVTTSSRLTADIVKRVVNLDIAFNGLTSLSGIEHLTNLTSLFIPSSQLRDLTPLKGLHKLANLTIDNSPNIRLADIAGLYPLETLSLSNDNIDSDSRALPNLSRLFNLYSLDLSNNAISDLTPLSGLKQLMTLNMADNDLSDISVLSGLKQLYRMNLSNDDAVANGHGNAISDLTPLGDLPLLVEFSIINQRAATTSNTAGTVSLPTAKSTDGTFIAPQAGSIQPNTGSYNPSTGQVTWAGLKLGDKASFSVFAKDFPNCPKGCTVYSGTISTTITQPTETESLAPNLNKKAIDPVPDPEKPKEPHRPSHKPTTPTDPTPDPDPDPDPTPVPTDNSSQSDTSKQSRKRNGRTRAASEQQRPRGSISKTGAAVATVAIAAIALAGLGIAAYTLARRHRH